MPNVDEFSLCVTHNMRVDFRAYILNIVCNCLTIVFVCLFFEREKPTVLRSFKSCLYCKICSAISFKTVFLRLIPFFILAKKFLYQR